MAEPGADLAFLRVLFVVLAGLVALFVVSQLSVVEHWPHPHPVRRFRAGLAGLLLAVVITVGAMFRQPGRDRKFSSRPLVRSQLATGFAPVAGRRSDRTPGVTR